jgi:hypothetical protein
MVMNKFPEVLLEDIYKKVKVEGWHPMGAVRAFGEAWGYNGSQRAELFDEYVKYCEARSSCRTLRSICKIL